KSSRAADGSASTTCFTHVPLPSSVRSTVAPDPLVHATLSDTALTPRKREVTPLIWGVHIVPNTALSSAIHVKRQMLAKSSPSTVQLRRFHQVESSHVLIRLGECDDFHFRERTSVDDAVRRRTGRIETVRYVHRGIAGQIGHCKVRPGAAAGTCGRR